MPRRFLTAVLLGAGSVLAALGAHAAGPQRSGRDFMSPALQAMQDDDASNPGMLWVRDGEALWNHAAKPGARSCASCHGDAAASMKGVAARYPAFSTEAARPIDLRQRINLCRTQHQDAPPLAADSDELLGLESFVAFQSRGQSIAPPADPRLTPFRERGDALFHRRMGQLDLSCAQCHEDHAGQRLGGSTIPQAHATGYPIYRLEWQGMGGLPRRLRGCMAGVRAEPFADDAPELVDLELYLAWRARGLPVETPAVRP